MCEFIFKTNQQEPCNTCLDDPEHKPKFEPATIPFGYQP